MSAYTDFIRDFPDRCLKILDSFEFQARQNDLEVTMMLAIATAGFVIPFERLRPPDKEQFCHPFKEREKFEAAAKEFESIYDIKFLKSRLWNENANSWSLAKDIKNVHIEPELWPELPAKQLSKEKRVRPVLKHLRNALAHGNIKTKGDPIKQILFLNKPTINVEKYDLIAVTPDDFRKFLKRWFEFLNSLSIPTSMSQEEDLGLLERAAV